MQTRARWNKTVIGWTVGLGLLLVAPAVLLAADQLARVPADAKSALKWAQDKLRSQRTNDRVEALKKLRDYALPESAKIIFDRGLRDKQADVRGAAIDALFAYKNDAKIRAFLSDFVTKESARKEPSPDVSVALAILFSTDDLADRKEVEDSLEKYLQAPDDAQRFLAALADAWTRNASKESLPQLVILARTELVAKRFAFQRAIIQSLVRFQEPEAIDSLIDLLADVKGEIRIDIVRHLTSLTGQKFGIEAAPWKDWWRRNKTQYQPPVRYTLTSVETLAAGAQSSYYGLPLYAQRMVFVLDTSGSMAGLRLEAAKAELHKAIEGLPGTVGFSIVVFNSEVGVWQKQLVPATPEAKRAAHLFVANQPAERQTATFDALQAAFLFDAEAIYFLSDGAPTIGTIVRPADIVSTITRGNRGRLVSIYTIGIGDELRGPSGAFMQQIAEQNFGVYRRVN